MYFVTLSKRESWLVAKEEKYVRAWSPKGALEKVLKDERLIPGFGRFLRSIKVYSFFASIFGVRKPIASWFSEREKKRIEREEMRQNGIICPECDQDSKYISVPVGFESDTDEYKCSACETITKMGPYTVG